MASEIFSIGNVLGASRSAAQSNQNDRSGNGSATVVNLNRNSKVADDTTNVNELKRQAGELNEFIQRSRHNLEFSVDDSSGFIVITVTEEDTGKFIRQIPAEEFIAIASLLNSEPENQGISPGLLIAENV